MVTEESRRFQQRLVKDAAAATRALTVSVGHRLGLYAAMADSAPVTIDELAARTRIDAGYAREWLHAQVSGGYVILDEKGERYCLPPEHVPALADPECDAFVAPFFSALKALYGTEDGLLDAYRSGGGVPWDQHSNDLDEPLSQYFLPSYRANLVNNWIAALEDVPAKLERGGRVADVGCGVGYSTLLMAEAFPHSTFVGSDYFADVVDKAAKLAANRGRAVEQIRFETAAADCFTGGPFDLVTTLNCVHDIGDPDAMARHIHSQLAADGTWMIVEPNAHPDPRKNTHPAGRLFMALSAVMCLPVAAAQHGPRALGNHAGESVLREIAEGAGFSRWRKAATTPVSVVYEVRP